MTTTAITFEVDGMALALPDASGLAPLTLPALPTPDAAPSQAAVDRFQAAMQEATTQQAVPQEAQPQDNAASKTAVLLMQLGTPATLEHTTTQEENPLQPTAQTAAQASFTVAQPTVVAKAPTPQTQPAATETTVATPQNAATPAVAEATVTTIATVAPAPEAKQAVEPTVAQATTTETALPAEPPQVVGAATQSQQQSEAASVAQSNVTPSTATTYTQQETTAATIPAQPVVEQSVVTPEVPVESPVVASKAAVVDSSSEKDLENVEEDSDSADQVTASAVSAGASSGAQIPVNAVQASPVSPASVPAFDGVVSVSEGISGAGMTSAQIEELVEAVAAQIRVERSLQAGEGTVTIQLKPAVLEGSQISLSAKNGSLSVEIAPTTASVAERIQGAVPRLEAALAGHVAEFHSFSVILRKGRKDETA